MGTASARGWVGLALLALVGCGSGESKLAAVQGRVFYRGQPVPGGTIVFVPDPERGGGGPLAASEISADGTYTLHTGTRPGAVPGWHRVTVAHPVRGQTPANSTRQGEPALAGGWTLPRRFSHPDQSGQVHEVKAGTQNVIDIKLE